MTALPLHKCKTIHSAINSNKGQLLSSDKKKRAPVIRRHIRIRAPRYKACAVAINNNAALDFNAQSFSALTFLRDRPTLKCAALAAALESTHRCTYAIIQHSSTKKKEEKMKKGLGDLIDFQKIVI